MKPEVIDFMDRHAREIFEMNRREGIVFPLSEDDLVRGYTSPGSRARTLVSGTWPIACAGIIRMAWNIGEAWLLTGPLVKVHTKSLVKSLVFEFPQMAYDGKFHRVQATCFDIGREHLFSLLGFQREATLRCYGPHDEDAVLYSRIFDWGI